MQLFSEIVTLTVTHPRKKWQEFCRLARDKKITHSPKSTNSSFLIQTPPPANTRLPAPHSPTAYWMTANSLHARRKHIKILERESLRIISSSTLSCLVLILRHGRSFSLFRQWVLRWIVRSRCLLKVSGVVFSYRSTSNLSSSAVSVSLTAIELHYGGWNLLFSKLTSMKLFLCHQKLSSPSHIRLTPQWNLKVNLRCWQ